MTKNVAKYWHKVWFGETSVSPFSISERSERFVFSVEWDFFHGLIIISFPLGKSFFHRVISNKTKQFMTSILNINVGVLKKRIKSFHKYHSEALILRNFGSFFQQNEIFCHEYSIDLIIISFPLGKSFFHRVISNKTKQFMTSILNINVGVLKKRIKSFHKYHSEALI